MQYQSDIVFFERKVTLFFLFSIPICAFISDTGTFFTSKTSMSLYLKYVSQWKNSFFSILLLDNVLVAGFEEKEGSSLS